MSYYYSVTVKKNSGLPIREDYENWLYNAMINGLHIDYYLYEIDKKQRLHIHGIATGRKNLYKKRFMLEGYHQKIDKIDSNEDLVRWMRYIEKDYKGDIEMDQRIVSNLIYNSYSFI